MKILVPTAGPLPAKQNARYIVNVAKRLGAGIIALHILKEGERMEKGEEALSIFSKAGQNAEVNVVKKIKKGDMVSSIIDTAEEESADIVIMGASQGKVVAEWVSADVMGKTTIPVLVIPHAFQETESH
jgi:nucleotide-binding universal stress UspA family protein